MKYKPIHALILTLLCWIAAAALAPWQSQTKRNINETDLFEFVWIADAQISPDGSQVVCYRVVPNQERTGYNGAIWMVATSGVTAPFELISG